MKKTLEKTTNKISEMVFQNLSQNRKARDIRSHTTINMKSLPTLFQDQEMKNLKKNGYKVVKCFFQNSNQNRKAVKSERDNRSHTRFQEQEKRYAHTNFKTTFFPKKSALNP